MVLPHRRTFIVVESFVAVGGLSGAVQLLTGTYAPPISALDSLGLSTWDLPALWLLATTTVPASVAAWLAWRRSPSAPRAVQVASLVLVIELVVQIPFLGLNPLQAVFGTVAVVMATLATRSEAAWRAASVIDPEHDHVVG